MLVAVAKCMGVEVHMGAGPSVGRMVVAVKVDSFTPKVIQCQEAKDYQYYADPKLGH